VILYVCYVCRYIRQRIVLTVYKGHAHLLQFILYVNVSHGYIATQPLIWLHVSSYIYKAVLPKLRQGNIALSGDSFLCIYHVIAAVPQRLVTVSGPGMLSWSNNSPQLGCRITIVDLQSVPCVDNAPSKPSNPYLRGWRLSATPS